MILRRIMQHVREQNWFAVGLDFVIVVAGVLLAFQITAWNDARASDARGRGYLTRIQADLSVDIEIYNDRMAFWDTVSGHGARALAAFEATSEAATARDDWALILDFMHASQHAHVQSSQSAYREIISAGELGLIRNPDFRRAISEYYALQEYPIFQDRPAYRVTVRELIPVDVQQFIWGNCYREVGNSSYDILDCTSPITAATAHTITDQILSEPEIERQLRYWISSMAGATLVMTGRRDDAVELRDAIAAELEATQ